MRRSAGACLDGRITTGEPAARAAVRAAGTIAGLRCFTGGAARCGRARGGDHRPAAYSGHLAPDRDHGRGGGGEVLIIAPPRMRASRVTRAGSYSGTGRVAVTP